MLGTLNFKLNHYRLCGRFSAKVAQDKAEHRKGKSAGFAAKTSVSSAIRTVPDFS